MLMCTTVCVQLISKIVSDLLTFNCTWTIHTYTANLVPNIFLKKINKMFIIENKKNSFLDYIVNYKNKSGFLMSMV